MHTQKTTATLALLLLLPSAPQSRAQTPAQSPPRSVLTTKPLNAGAAPVPQDAAPTSDEQVRKTQEITLGDLLTRMDAAATLMGRGQTREAIAAYLPILHAEPNFSALADQKSVLLTQTDALQKQIFQQQRQISLQSASDTDAMATQKIALEGQLAAVQKLLDLQAPFAEAHANLAHLLVESGAAAAGLAQYEAAIRLRPALKNTLRPALLHAHLTEADRLAALGRPEAAAEYREAINLDPANASAHAGLGNLLLALGKPEEALPELQEAARRDPANAEAALTLGLALYRSGQQEPARRQWRRLAGSQDERTAAEAQGMLDRYRLTPAASGAPMLSVQDLEVQRCREQVRNYPNEASTHNNLALALYHAKQKAEAFQEVQTALHLDPDSLEAHTNLGMLLRDDKQGDGAVEEYKRALKIDSENGAIHNDLGVVYFDRQQWKLAEYEFRKALALDHSDPYAHHNLANTLLQEGRLAESIRECGKTLEYDPKFFAAYGTRGLIEDKEGEAASGLADLKLTVHSDPDPAQALLNLEDPLRQFAGHRLAALQFREILRGYPQTAEGEAALGRLLLADGQDEEAAAEFRIVLGLQSGDASSHFLLARALLRQGQVPEAIAEAREALRLEPRSGDAMNTLGLALYQSGQKPEGRAEWDAAAKSDDKDAARNAAGLLSEFPQDDQVEASK